MDSRNYSMSESFTRMFSPCYCHGKPPYLNTALLNLTKVFGPSFCQSMYIPFPLCIHLFGMNVVFQYASPCRYQMTSDRDISSLHSIDLYIWLKLERVILTFPTTTLWFYLLILLYMERQPLTCHIHRDYLEMWTSLQVSSHSPRLSSEHLEIPFGELPQVLY